VPQALAPRRKSRDTQNRGCVIRRPYMYVDAYRKSKPANMHLACPFDQSSHVVHSHSCGYILHGGLVRTTVFCRSGETAAAADCFWLCARTAKERTFTHFAHDLVQSMCALHKHEVFALSHLLRPYSGGNLGVARRIYNYRLTWARRMLEWAFGIVCNKWRIFHCAIDVCPYFCDVIVTTFCMLQNFARQRDGFQCQDTFYVCPLENIKAVGNRVNVNRNGYGEEGSEDGNVSPLWSLAGGKSTGDLTCGDGHLPP